MSNKSKHPRCPLCGGKSQEAKGGGFQCTAPLCGGFFDSKPNEGGDVWADPSRRMMLQEQEQERAAREKSRRVPHQFRR